MRSTVAAQRIERETAKRSHSLDGLILRGKTKVEMLHDIMGIKAMHLRTLLVFAAALALLAQQQPRGRQVPPPLPQSPDEIRLPNGRLQRDEILKVEYQKSVEDARELAKLADELKVELEKSDRNVLSVATLKKTEEIEKIAKRIHDRLKHN